MRWRRNWRKRSTMSLAQTDPPPSTRPRESPAGCAAFIGEAQRNPPWGALIAHGLWAFPTVARDARERLNANLRRAQSQDRLASFSEEVGFDLVVGIVVQAMRSASEARLSATCRTSFRGYCVRSASGRKTQNSRCGAHGRWRLRRESETPPR